MEVRGYLLLLTLTPILFEANISVGFPLFGQGVFPQASQIPQFQPRICKERRDCRGLVPLSGPNWLFVRLFVFTWVFRILASGPHPCMACTLAHWPFSPTSEHFKVKPFECCKHQMPLCKISSAQYSRSGVTLCLRGTRFA